MGRFEDALSRPGLGAIAEIKRRSPSAGDLRPDADPAVIAPSYAHAGAAAISVLVDERFGGTWHDLRAARAATAAPLLAKGFFSTEEHLRTAKEAGADAALLLLRDLDDAQTAHLLEIAARLGLDTLVEAHDAQELDRGIALGARVLGVNARDLSTFAIDRAAQLALLARIPADRIVIAESGIQTRAQGAAAELAGADAVLVGSALMRAAEPAAKLAEILSRPLVKVCGLTRRRGRGGCRPRRVRARAGEPACRLVGAAGAGGDALGRRLGRRGRRLGRGPRPSAHDRGGQGARPRRGASARRP
jgi:indole-3-glycerol phosphate synthase